MKKLKELGALISFNTEKGFYEVQKIDDVEQAELDFGINYIPKLQSDDVAKGIAIGLGIEFLDAENPYKVANFLDVSEDYLVIQYDNYGSNGRNIGELFDWLGDEATIIQANELYQYACLDDVGNVFQFTDRDEINLFHDGIVTLAFTGETIEDYKETHEDFYNWFFNIVKV